MTIEAYSLKVQLPVRGTLWSTKVLMDSILKQLKHSDAIILYARITDHYLHIQISSDTSGSVSALPDYVEHNNSYQIQLNFLHVKFLGAALYSIYQKILVYQHMQAHLAEITFHAGDGIHFELNKASWQPKVFFTPEVKSSLEPSSLLVIDGMNLLARLYHATAYKKEESELLRSPSGKYINALVSFVSKLVYVIRKLMPSHLCVLWDVDRKLTWRKQMYPAYKASRDRNIKRPSFSEQIATCQNLLNTMNIEQITIDSYEADDIIGTLASSWSQHMKCPCYMWSNDKDLFQILDFNIVQLVDEVAFTNIDFQNKYNGLQPNQWIDYKAIVGDATDDIPGIPGVGKTHVVDMLLQYECLENITASAEKGLLNEVYKRYVNKFIEGKDLGEISKKLATIVLDIKELRELKWESLKTNINNSKFKGKLKELNIYHPELNPISVRNS